MRIFSGIQPTGRKHLGNYIGAIRGYVEGQERGDPAIYCIVDLHATSVAYDPGALPGYVLDTAGDADGGRARPGPLHPVPPVRREGALGAVLAALSSVTAYGDLQRMTQFKDKSAREQRARARRACSLYPVLQAADILLYRADEVPVGEDQRQHLELVARDRAALQLDLRRGVRGAGGA